MDLVLYFKTQPKYQYTPSSINITTNYYLIIRNGAKPEANFNGGDLNCCN